MDSKKDSLVAFAKGTKANNVNHKAPIDKRNMLKEVTLDMESSINLIPKKYSLKQSSLPIGFMFKN